MYIYANVTDALQNTGFLIDKDNKKDTAFPSGSSNG
jgi:hypothetical protein